MIVDLADNDDHDRLPRYFKGQESMDNNTIIEYVCFFGSWSSKKVR